MHLTMAKHGSNKVEITEAGDKCQITVVFAGTLSGTFYLRRLFTKVKQRDVCLLLIWHITFTHSHWANESIVKDYISKIIIFPYVENKKRELKLLIDQRAL